MKLRRDRHEGPQVVPLGAALPHPCPECGAKMRLRDSRHGLFYGCVAYPDCNATHGAHRDGKPLGIPANGETRKARRHAHEVFDRLWQGKGAPMRRNDAYEWLAAAMGIEEVHFGSLDAQQCAEAVAIITKRYARLYR